MCDKWYHTMCEVLTPLEEMTVANDEQYKCLSCNAGNTDQPDEEQRSEKFSVGCHFD